MTTLPDNSDKTLIDILQKGNQELFHSAILAWMLSPKESHGIGDLLLVGIAERLASKGHPNLQRRLNTHGSPVVDTEVSRATGRHDITLTFNGFTLVFENKTKTVGNEAQLERYRQSVDLVVPLGLTDVSFHESVDRLITYAEVLDILESAQPPRTAFGALVDHYVMFLRRETRFLNAVQECYRNGNSKAHREIATYPNEVSHFTSNDARFVNLCILEWFRRERLISDPWSALDWHSNKNQSSGVWLASHGSSTPVRPCLRQLHGDESASYWLHIELKDGVFATSLDDTAGEIQIRCSTPESNRELLKNFQDEHTLQGTEQFPQRKPAERYDTFFLIRRPVLKRHLQFPVLEDTLRAFGRKFLELWH